MSEVLKSKTVADKFFKELLQKIKGSKYERGKIWNLNQNI